jgi:hypothetical protein
MTSDSVGWTWRPELFAERRDALFVATDPMAAGVYRALDEASLRIPDDIAVVGFDGLPRGPVLTPPLTTVVPAIRGDGERGGATGGGVGCSRRHRRRCRVRGDRTRR